MLIRLIVEAEVEKVSGVFVAKDDLAEEILSELESADPGTLTVDDSEYEVTSWTIEQVVTKTEVLP